MIWEQYVLLASNVLIFSKRLEFEISYPWRRALRADCTKLLEHLQECTQGSDEVLCIQVPVPGQIIATVYLLVSSKQEYNSFRRLDSNPSFSANSCNISPISCLKRLFFRICGKFANSSLRCTGIWYHPLRSQTKRLILSSPLTKPGATDTCIGMIISTDLLPAYQPCKNVTIDIRTFRQL